MKYFFLLISFLSISSCFSQDELNLLLELEEYHMKTKLRNSTVKAYANNSLVLTVDTDKSGKAAMNLPLGRIYTIEFSHKGYSSRSIEFDTYNLTEEDMAGGFSKIIKMRMFIEREGFNDSLLVLPIGKASFDYKANDLKFETGYTSKLQSKIDAEHERLDELNKEAFEKKMEEAKAAKLAKDKKRAYLLYCEAVALMPGSKAAREKRKSLKPKS